MAINSARYDAIEKEGQVSYILFNINFTVLRNLAKRHHVNSFFYCYLTDNSIEYEYYERDCRLTKMFDIDDNSDSILDIIINRSGFVAFRQRSLYFITENTIEEDEISVVKSDDIEKDIENFIEWYHKVYSVKLESRYFKNHYAYAICNDDKILFYTDRQGRLFLKINLTKAFGTIYHAYKAFYHFRLKDNN